MNAKKGILIALMLFAHLAINAQEIAISTVTEFSGNEQFYIHTVATGQNICNLARAYAVNTEAIMKYNPYSAQGIKPGDILKIPVNNNISLGMNYVVHKVSTGETLFRIAMNYGVRVDELRSLNPGLTESIQPGQEIKIPPGSALQHKTAPNRFTIHIVQPGETLFSIGRKYNTEISEIRRLNPGLTDNIQPGQQIKVPVPAPTPPEAKKDSTDPAYKCGTSGKLPVYDVAMMIPLYLEATQRIDTGDAGNSGNYKSLSFIQFYEGVRLAADSLEKSGLSLKIHVYDVNENTESESFLNTKPELKNMNLIIGPFFSSSYEKISVWAKNQKIVTVNPFTSKDELITANPYSMKINASDSTIAERVLEFTGHTYPGANVIVIYNDKQKDMAGIFGRIAHRYSTSPDELSVKLVYYPDQGYSGMVKNLSDSAINIMITLMEGEAFVSGYLRSINELAYRHRIVLFGMKSWEDYNSLELEYLMNLNLHVWDHTFTDYSLENVQNFVRNFREKYNTEPDFFAFQGYDLMMYFANALYLYGKEFQRCLSDYNPGLLQTRLMFESSPGNGFANQSVCIYRYENYKAVDAILHPKKEILFLEKKP